MNILKTQALTKQQTEEVSFLVEECRKKWNMTLSFPFEEGNSFYLLYDTSLISALALIIPQPEESATMDDSEAKESPTAEAVAFTHPNRQREGCFSRLLTAAEEEIADLNLLFLSDGSNEEAKKTLEALGACLDSQEYKMELLLDNPFYNDPEISTAPDSRLTDFLSPQWLCDEDTAHLRLLFNHPPKDVMFSDKEAGSANAAFFKDTVCLYGFEIKKACRRRGFGTEGLKHFISYVKNRGCRLIFLHVSSHNEAAVSLYKKTGFRITETLSYWLY